MLQEHVQVSMTQHCVVIRKDFWIKSFVLVGKLFCYQVQEGLSDYLSNKGRVYIIFLRAILNAFQPFGLFRTF